MTARERVAREWHAQSDHAAESPFGGPMCNCLSVADRIIPMLREAWDEAAQAIGEHTYSRGEICPRNPYEGDQS